MKLPKLLAAAILSVSLYSCACEDENLGQLAFTDELAAFVPPQPAAGKSYYATFDDVSYSLHYAFPGAVTRTTIPVRKINYSGKFDLNSCKQYYIAEEKEHIGQLDGSQQYTFKYIYRKDADKQRFNPINTKEHIEDILEVVVGYNNPFPEPVEHFGKNYESYTTLRHFYFRDAVETEQNNYTDKQEFLASVTLNGIVYENVYHLYLTTPYGIYNEERYFSEAYPLDYVKGIYLKEGVGIIYAYTDKGKQVSITVE